MLLIILNCFNAPNQGVPVPKRHAQNYQELTELTYGIYGSNYSKNMHDLHFHLNKKPTTANKCAPICSELLFDRGAYDNESTSRGEGVTFYAHFVPKSTAHVKQDPKLSDDDFRSEADSDLVMLEEAPQWPPPKVVAKHDRKASAEEADGDDLLAVENGADATDEEADEEKSDATPGAHDCEDAPAHPPLRKATSLERFWEDFARTLKDGPPPYSRIIPKLDLPYEDQSDKNKRQIVHAALIEDTLWGVEASQKCNKCPADQISYIYHPDLQKLGRIGRTCSLCRMRRHGRCTAA